MVNLLESHDKLHGITYRITKNKTLDIAVK